MDLEPHPPAQVPVQRPGAVRLASGAQMGDGLGQARIGRGAGQLAGGAEIVQRPQDVIAPAVGVQQVQELRVGRLARRQAAEQVAGQQVFLPRPPRVPRAVGAAGGALILQQAFQHVEGTGEGGTGGTGGALAVPAAVGLAVIHQALDQGTDIGAEIGAVGHRAAVDAFLHLPLPIGLAALVPAGVGTDQGDGAPGPFRGGVQAEFAQLVQREGRGRPGLAAAMPFVRGKVGGKEGAAGPLPVRVLASQQPGAPAFRFHLGTFRRPVRLRQVQQVPHHLPADGRIGPQEPKDHGVLVRHGALPVVRLDISVPATPRRGVPPPSPPPPRW
ncbi:hypothetical protein AZA_79906 [Nitrospirillum viridazoti Y2]|nr:hypothetical protein AZA_79906 [Nitrospirillum amazonense Y2]